MHASSINRYCVLLSLLTTAPLEAQLRGTVRDEVGDPVAGAQVEVWSDTPTPFGRLADAEGRFFIPEERLRHAERLSIRRIGFRTLVVAYAPADTVVMFTLEVDPVQLSPVTVRPLPQRVPCPPRNQPRGVAIWETARSMYLLPPAGSAFREMVLTRSEIRPQPSYEDASDEQLRSTWEYWSPEARDGSSQQKDIHTDYATRLPWERFWYRAPREEFFAWEYAPLFTYAASHFASPEFGGSHRFGVFRESADGIVLVFCPARRESGSIEGFISLETDGSLHSVRWSYRTDEPDERAGAEVVFYPRAGADAPASLLTAERATYWRRMHGRGRYTQHWYRFLHWDIGPDVTPVRR
ncbi:hypothetical protein BH23GEM8_BH23GEM8_07980 [soil metagenome]